MPLTPEAPSLARRALGIALGLLVAVAAAVPWSTGTAAAAPPVVGSTVTDCAPNGSFARPAGPIVPGYIYSPTSYNGTATVPQPDDTWVSTAHVPHTGTLRTRQANGREELLVCAHIGTNTPDDAITPFPTTGTGAHAANIVPVVQIIDAAGNTSTFDFTTTGLTDLALAHYASSTDVHEGVFQMWVPVPTTVGDPGFTVRTEIHGTAGLPTFGAAGVAGADEVYIHVGNMPTARNAQVDQSVGLALDDAVIAERPSDPGPDDLATMLPKVLDPVIKQAIAEQAPIDIDDSWDWSLGLNVGVSGGGTIRTLPFSGGITNLNVVEFNPQAANPEARLEVTIEGRLYPNMVLQPRSWGVETITSGDCEVDAQVDVKVRAGLVFDLQANNTAPAVEAFILDSSSTFVSSQEYGTLLGLFGVFGVGVPHPVSCDWLHGKISDGIKEQMKERMDQLGETASQDKLTAGINAKVPGSLADVQNGPLANATVPTQAGGGFGIANARYQPTAPILHAGGQVYLTRDGLDAAAKLSVTDMGGTRFPFSYTPTASSTLIDALHRRTRPSAGGNTTPPVAGGGGGEISQITADSTVAAKTATIAKTALAANPTTASVTNGAQLTASIPDPPATVVTAPSTTTTRPIANIPSPPLTVAPASTTTTRPIANIPDPPVTVVTAPSTTTTRPTANIPPGACCIQLEQQVTDFDVALLVNGSTVNSLLRALTAGGTTANSGLLDIDEKGTVPGVDPDLTIRPTVVPMYLPTAPAGWQAPGNVQLFVPSLSIARTDLPITLTADLQVGTGATIDTATNHLKANASTNVVSRARYLRVVGSNTTADPTAAMPTVQDKIKELVTPKITSAINAVQVPNLAELLKNGGQASFVLSHLTLETVSGGHLGVFFNVDPNNTTVGLGITFNQSAPDVKPSSFKATATASGFPTSGSYAVSWTVYNTETGLVRYQSSSPEPGLSKTFNFNLATAGDVDQCTGDVSATVRVRAVVSRANVSNVVTTTASSPMWITDHNTHLCKTPEEPGPGPGPL